MANGQLTGKKILFISAKLFNISEYICKEFERLGADVDYFDERPSNTVLMKALIRINRDLASIPINRYYDEIIKATANRDYDYIIFVKGESISPKQLSQFRQCHKNAKLIYYHWDSLYYNKNAKNVNRYFDKVMTFDPVDAKTYGIDFLPAFYVSDFAKISDIKDSQIVYDAAFIGTMHSDRYKIITDISRQVTDAGGSMMSYFYFQSRLMYYKRKYIDRSIGFESESFFNYRPLSFCEILQEYSKSTAILDIHFPHQNGLSLRTIELLGARRKIITTNKNITQYDFYHPDNVLVIDRDKPVVPISFLRSPYHPVDDDIYRKYSIDSWIKQLIK